MEKVVVVIDGVREKFDNDFLSKMIKNYRKKVENTVNKEKELVKKGKMKESQEIIDKYNKRKEQKRLSKQRCSLKNKVEKHYKAVDKEFHYILKNFNEFKT